MSDDFDSRYKFPDNHGGFVYVWAGSEAEAWRLAQPEIAAHDAAASSQQHHQEQGKSGDWHVSNVDQVIDDAYNDAMWWHNNRIAGDACKSCGINHDGGCMAKPTDGEILDANSYGQLAGETRPTQYGKRGPAVYVTGASPTLVNNTIYGGATASGQGIVVNDNAAPTIMNNIIANTATAIQITGATAQTGTIVGYNLFQGNNANGTAGSSALTPAASAPLFVDSLTNNFYLAAGSLAIPSGPVEARIVIKTLNVSEGSAMIED